MRAPTDDRPTADNRRGLIVLVSAVIVLDMTFYYALAPLLPHYVHHYGFSKTQAGLLVAAYPLGTLVGSLPAGIAASRLGVRPIVLAGLAGLSATTLIFGFAGSAVVLDSARFVQGLSGACTWAGSLAWLTSVTPVGRRSGVIGAVFGVAYCGTLLGPVVGAIASRIGTGPAFAIAGVVGIALMIWALFFPVPPRAGTQRLRDILPALRDPIVTGGIWLTVLVGAVEGVIYVLGPLRMNALGAGPIAIAATFLGAAAVTAALSPFVGRMADHLGRARPIQFSLGAGVVVALLAPIVGTAGLLGLVLAVGLGIAGTLFVPASSMLSTGAERWGMHQGLGFGLSGLAWAAGQAFGASGSGAIAQATSDLVPCLLLACACGLTLVAGPRAAARLAARLG